MKMELKNLGPKKGHRFRDELVHNVRQYEQSLKKGRSLIWKFLKKLDSPAESES